ncbi:MAG: hypothetical protein C4583_10565 [Anaerolineaceae bacterium]|nr:MAG: hypothetical protein C4583_10565 [Anaerolineaceae bacterium]
MTKYFDATLIHVYGTDRSGSTMLDLILGNAPDAFSCGEVSAWFRPYRKHHFRVECVCGEKPCPVWEKLKDLPEAVFHARLAKELGVRFVIDSSKDICWLIDAQRWAADQGLRMATLLIWKDPVDLAYSYWKRGRDAIAWRDAFVKCYGWVQQIGLPYVSVQYDDLVREPVRTVGALCAALEIPYFEGKINFWNKQCHHLFGSTGIRIQASSKDSCIESKKVYPQEFEAQRSRLLECLARDAQAQRIIRALKQADILLVPPKDIYATRYVPKRVPPFWYFRKKTLRILRRYFPERYEYSAGMEIETIPERHSS